MNRARRLIYAYFTLGFAVIGAAIIAITLIVYVRLTGELVEKNRQILEQRVMFLQESISAIFDRMAGSAALIMASLPKEGLRRDGEILRDQITRFERQISGCRKMWIKDADGRIAYDRVTAADYFKTKGWWTEFGGERSLGAGRSLFARESEYAAAAGRPFQDPLGTTTILPFAIAFFEGVEPLFTAFVEIDVSTVFFDLSRTFTLAVDKNEYPIEFSLYTGEGLLVESSANFPRIVREPMGERRAQWPDPDGAESRRSGVIEASVRDEELDLIFSGAVSGRLIRERVWQVAMLILIVGASCLAVAVSLGIFSMRTFNRMKNYEHEQLQERFQALQAKMNPHFLFNTLDGMIGAVEEGNKEKLLTMLKCLSRTLRAAIRGARDVISFAEELEYVESFVFLQRMRYAGRFEMQSDVEKEVLDCGVYQFSVQPLVENAFTHGVQETNDFIGIRLSIRRDGDRIQVDVSDTGPGAPPDILSKLQESFSSGKNKLDHWSALVGVNNRLRMIYGRPFGLSLLPVEKGFGLRLTCPLVASH